MVARGVPLATIRRVGPLAACKLRRVTLKDLVHRMQEVYRPGEPAAFLGVARWMRQELRIRFAHQLWEYYKQPSLLMSCRSFLAVHDMHLATFEALSAFEQMDSDEDVVRFTRMLEGEFRAHSETLQLLRSGIAELRSCPGALEVLQLQAFLDRFLVTKIGNRVLVDNFVDWVGRAGSGDASASSTGVVTSCRLSPLLSETAEDVCGLAQEVYGRCPEVSIDSSLDTEVLLVPAHLQFIFREVLKNAAAATVAHLADARGSERKSRFPFSWASAGPGLPPVHVAIHPGKYDVEIRVADQGGGMKRRELRRIWEYGFSGKKADEDCGEDGTENCDRDLQLQMSGFGVGIPLSRLYARYFGGDMLVHSVYGFGTDVSIRMNRLGDHVELGCSPEESDDEQEQQR